MSAITFKAVVAARRKDGTYPVRIRVTFKGVSRRLPTNLIAQPPDLTRSLHIKSPNLLNKTAALISQMRATIADLSPFALEDWDADKVVAHIRRALSGESFRLDFFVFADGFIAGKEPQTRRTYITALNSLAAYLGARELDINDITRRLVLDWMAWIEAQPGYNKQRSTQSTRNAQRVGHIYRAAQSRYNDDDRTLIPRTPFLDLPRTPHLPEGSRALTTKEMQMVLDARVYGNKRTTLDIFILSFATMGANMADLWAARVSGPEWVYMRQKTKNRRQDRAEMRVTIQPEAEPYIKRLAGRGPYWLNVLREYSSNKDGCTRKANRNLKSWAKRAGLEDVEHISFYSARKTWATIARSIGVEKALVDECLTHIGDFPVTDIYARRDYGRMNAANRAVLDTLQFPGVRDL